MPITSYSYSLSNDFPGGQINPTKLHDEILQSSIATQLDGVTTNNDTVSITFLDVLSAGEKTTLDNDVTGPAGGLIAAHDNSELLQSGFLDLVTKTSLESTTSKEFVTYLSITTEQLSGIRPVIWSVELGNTESPGVVTLYNVTDDIELDRSRVEAGSVSDKQLVSGFGSVTFNNEPKVLEIRYKSQKKNKLQEVQNGKIGIL